MNYSPRGKPFRMTLGDRGEIIAANFLIEKGYRIAEKNYRCRLGEVDLIAEKAGRLVFFEVKTRANRHFGRHEESVHLAKQRKIVRLAQWYLKEKRITGARAGFGVVAVTWRGSGDPDIRLIDDAFSADEEQDR